MDTTTAPTGATQPAAPVTTRANISREAVARLAPFIPARDIRYYLCGLHIRSAAPKPGVYVEATDGAMLGIIYEPDGELQCDNPEAGVIIKVSRELVAACRRGIRVPTPKDGSPTPVVPRVLVNARRVSVAASHEAAASSLEWFVQPGNSIIEGRFPEMARVLPNWKRLMPEVNGPVNSQLLAKILAAASGLPSAGSLSAGMSPVRFWTDVTEQNGVVVVQFERIANMVALVMPMRGDVKVEEWITRLVEQMPERATKQAAERGPL